MIELRFKIRVPSLNGSYKCSGSYGRKKAHSHLYMSKQGHQFKKDMERMIKEIYKECPVDYPVDMWTQFFYKGRRGRDVSSGVKILEDSLNELVYKDDNQIRKHTLEIFEPAEEDEVRIFLRPMSEEQLARIERMCKNKEV